MAQKRMFDLDVVDQDKFIDMPATARLLYYELGMRADDEGFISPKRVIRMLGASEDDLKILIAKGYLILFESGVVVITDWRQNNYLDKNRIKKTQFQEEKSMLELDTLNRYRLNVGLTSVKHSFNQYSIEEKSIEEKSIEENNNIYTKNKFLADFNEIRKKYKSNARDISMWTDKTDRQFRKLRKKIVKKLKEEGKGLDIIQEYFKKVIHSAFQDDFHKDNGYKYITVEFITREDKFLRLYQQAPKPSEEPDEWQPGQGF